MKTRLERALIMIVPPAILAALATQQFAYNGDEPPWYLACVAAATFGACGFVMALPLWYAGSLRREFGYPLALATTIGVVQLAYVGVAIGL